MVIPEVNIRRETPADAAAVRRVNESAFETSTEADLVERLHAGARPLVSLVAEEDGAIVGHILFSPVTLSGAAETPIMGLAPMAVVPAHQQRGIGSALVRAGLLACKELGFDAVVVLGHAEYYPRFGFQPAARFGVSCEYDVPDDVFMALELTAGALGRTGGTIRYHGAFASG
jgi:putative acetyltransferase